jgi:two-component system, NarL family, response regulator LiaR
MAIRILITDDVPTVRQDVHICLEPDTGPNAPIDDASTPSADGGGTNTAPDAALINLLMRVLDSIMAMDEIREKFPGVGVQVVTHRAALGEAIAVDNGPTRTVRHRPDNIRPGDPLAGPQAALAVHGHVSRRLTLPDSLTGRETDVLRLLAQGRANKEIAHTLTIGEKTVKTHVSNILAKLGVESRTQAALQALHAGFVPTSVGG